MSTATDIADALVTALQSNGFDEAERKWAPYFEREDCASRKCVVVPRNVTYPDGSRDGYDETYDLEINLQQAIDAADETTIDTLDGLRETLARLFGADGALQRQTMAGAVLATPPEHQTGQQAERALLIDSHLYHSILTVQYTLEPT